MYSKEQIEAAHKKVKNGADFQKYVKELLAMEVKSHEVSLTDGSWTFKGKDGGRLSWIHGPSDIVAAALPSQRVFKLIWKDHQNGVTDYLTFCREAGMSGVERWVTDFENGTVTYYDRHGGVVSVEKIRE